MLLPVLGVALLLLVFGAALLLVGRTETGSFRDVMALVIRRAGAASSSDSIVAGRGRNEASDSASSVRLSDRGSASSDSPVAEKGRGTSSSSDSPIGGRGRRPTPGGGGGGHRSHRYPIGERRLRLVRRRLRGDGVLISTDRTSPSLPWFNLITIAKVTQVRLQFSV